MKKQITLIILLIIHFTSWSQKSIPTDGPCTDEMVLKVKGKWFKLYPDNITTGTKTEQQEAFNRLDHIKDMLIKIHPDPIGFDVSWHRNIGISYFGAKHKYSNSENDRSFEIYNMPSLATFGLNVDDRLHYCDNAKINMMWSGEINQSSHSEVSVTVNNIEISVGGGGEWTINGLPVKMRNPVLAEKWKGYDIQWPEYGSTARYVLIHRKGILPYIPVSRKQYLNQCLVATAKLYDKMIEGVKQTPVRSLEEQEKEKKAQLAQYEKDFGKNTPQYKSAADYYLSGYQTDQQRRDEQLKNAIKIKEDELKKFTNELEKTTKEGLLDSPAVVLGMYFSDIVFETNPEKGFMLVTENPDYIRKDLPKYIPQVFVLSWSSWWDRTIPEKNIAKVFEQNFPVEKLQAMIDK